MKAVILAAGKGQRLYPYTKKTPKALLKINKKTILEHQLDNLKYAGITDVVVVTGYKKEQIENSAPNARFVYNENYVTTNSLYSLWIAKEELNDTFIYLHSDILFDKTILDGLIDAEGDFIISVEKKHCSDEDMKVKTENNSVKLIGKSIPPGEAFGEFTGIARFSKRGAEELVKALNKIMLREDADYTLWFESVLNWLIEDDFEVKIVETQGKNWIEIDFTEDLEKARNSIYQKIKDNGGF